MVLSAATAGMMGAFASKILAGQVLVDGAIVLAGPGEPLGAFIAALVGIELAQAAADIISFGIALPIGIGVVKEMRRQMQEKL